MQMVENQLWEMMMYNISLFSWYFIYHIFEQEKINKLKAFWWSANIDKNMCVYWQLFNVFYSVLESGQTIHTVDPVSSHTRPKKTVSETFLLVFFRHIKKIFKIR